MTKTPTSSDNSSSTAESNIKLTETQLKFLPYVMAVALFMQILDGTILNTALPQMAIALGESPLKMQWAVISYALTLAIFIPVSGFLADKYGTRKVFLSSIVVFTLGSLFCAMSSDLNMLVISRVFQGVGGAMMTPVARLILFKSYPRNKLLTVMNYAVIPALIAPLIGPLLGGYLVQYVSWHWIFLMNIPMGIIGFLVALKYVPELKELVARFDWLGFGLFAFAAALLTLAVEMVSRPNDTLLGSVLIAVGIGLLLAYVGHAKRSKAPLFPLSLFSVRTFRVGISGNLFTRLGISAVPYLLPILLQVAFEYTPSQAGWLLMPIAAGSMTIKPWVSKIIRTFSYRKVLVANTTILGLLIISIGYFDASMPWYWIAPILFVMGCCNSLQFSAMNTITIGDLKGTQTSSGNSLMAVNQQLAMSFGIAFGAAVLAIFSDRLHFETTAAFSSTFWVMGIVTITSGLYFLRLNSDDGQGMY
ncbi:DHA2 family efflux MFS transporter permease subunit [Psychrobacter sp. FDAARGOS_221]|uniref:DHA2 family efflux MFS transporter permease subunit n=1 Tax=Psychrobacter sp. FDAARGOS_221 TaxID=1975705 RepID=UPI000BB58F7C|nr:DHA2 family efflux MFS transporter permease subunit [Psychrobacter sp. FDAARGOS_221]PNK59594.1 MFS transporter [Psychrobacter sp. FDAARGOS_221]